MDTAQILLLSVIVLLSFLLVILGIQVFLILRELRKTVDKVNRILDDAATLTESISAPIENFSSIFAGIKTGVSLLNLFKKKKKGEEEEDNG